jgi:chloramphenicol 3-O-phosphotransferase
MICLIIMLIDNSHLNININYKNNTIILIRGTASSGKSTTAHYVADKLTEPFLIFSTEDLLFFHMIPEKYLVHGSSCEKGFSLERDAKNNIIKVSASAWGAEVYSLYQTTLGIYTKSGLNILCEGNFTTEDSIKNILQYITENYRIYIFSLKVPLEILEKREKNVRKDIPRASGFAKHQKETCDATSYMDDLVISLREDTSVHDISAQILNFCANNPGHSKQEILSRMRNQFSN